MNFVTQNTFEKGYSKELSDNFEKGNTFIDGWNGRLYSKDGAFSFSAIKGSKLVYENANVVKYLGVHSFEDEAIVFAKCLKPENSGQYTEEEICEEKVSSISFLKSSDVYIGSRLTIGNSISENSNIIQSCYTVRKPIEKESDFEDHYTEVKNDVSEVNFGEYYKERVNIVDFNICNVNSFKTPINNKEYYDMLLSFKLDEAGNIVGKQLWVGAQNWPMNGKISTEGVEENQYYKRVYYTDSLNSRRVVNIKDPELSKRTDKEFNQILDNVLLQPKIQQVKDGGQLKSMRVLYLYRIISENGQVSEFSPFSEYANVIPEEGAIEYRGGNISEKTNKMVVVECDILKPEESAEVECIAIEFEASGPPTAIKNLGIKKAQSKVVFNHFGTEPEMIDNITINDIVELKNTWKYCNDFTSKKNKLIAGGLRNNPVPTQIQNLEYLFPLHGWTELGNTYESLMNPEPWKYRYIDPHNDKKLLYVRKKRYKQISSFGPMTLSFKNRLSGNAITKVFEDLSIESYTNVLEDVLEWLLDEQENNPQFSQIFPNVLVSQKDNYLFLESLDEEIKSDLSNYVFESDNDQFIETFDNDLVFLDPEVDQENLVYGGESVGFNQGNGVRVTFREYKEPLLNQATKPYEGNDKLLDYRTPSMEKYCMKGELYRLCFQAYDNASSRYFAIPLGDIMVPELGDTIKEIDDNGDTVIKTRQYINQSVENGVLYGHGIKMHIEVRLDCDMKELISMYQIGYVERTENNRTILCQGFGAPLQRLQYNGSNQFKLQDEIRNTWTLPYYGGPVYEKEGFRSYDEFGPNFNYEGNSEDGDLYKRVMTSRNLFYLDSPDLYYNKISDQYLESSEINVMAKLNTDHNPALIMQRGDAKGEPAETYPKFSRKIREAQIEGDLHLEDLPRWAPTEGNKYEDTSREYYFINVSVFANYESYKRDYKIARARSLDRGEVISGAAFNLDHDVSNNAFGLSVMPWYYGSYQREWKFQGGDRANSEIFQSAMVSPGYKTAIIQTEEDLFDANFPKNSVNIVDSSVRLGGSGHVVYDTYPLINVFRNNRESVYGGRTKQAYSRNTFIPLSKTIPVSNNTGIQSFECGADTYITLNIRTKNDAGDNEIEKITMNNHGGARNRGDIEVWKRNAAWTYAMVVESQIEPKLTYDYEFYREGNTHRFDIEKTDHINEAYFNERNLKQFIPAPFKFEDDPNMGHVIAVSDVKLAGEDYDSWTSFKPNNFYAELEKNKGDISNLIRERDQIYAIQDGQTSLIYIGEDRLIKDENGGTINLKQGSGTIVEGHKVISNYGTKIRRAATESDFGFSFFDESKVEFVKIDKPLLTANLLHLDLFEESKLNPIVNTEAYFDHEHKETNIVLYFANGNSYELSYNEVLQCFNGKREITNDLYIPFKERIYAPKVGSNVIHQLNAGEFLNLFDQEKDLKLEVVVHATPNDVFIYKESNIVSSLNYPFKQLSFKTSTGQSRIITSDHPWYRIREGLHTVPAKNESELPEELADLRGSWMKVEITAESLESNKVDILALINHLRKSHQ